MKEDIDKPTCAKGKALRMVRALNTILRTVKGSVDVKLGKWKI